MFHFLEVSHGELMSSCTVLKEASEKKHVIYFASSAQEVLSSKAIQYGLSKSLFERLAEKHRPMLLDTQLLGESR